MQRSYKLGIIVAAIVVGSLATAPLRAQGLPVPRPQVSRDQQDVRTYVNRNFDPARDNLEQFKTYDQQLRTARCMANSATGQVQKGLESQYRSSQEKDLFERQGRMEWCGPVLVKITSLMRGTLAEGWYHKTHPGNALPTASVPQINALMASTGEWAKPMDAADRNLLIAMTCLAASDPITTAAILKTTSGSADEVAAMDRLFVNARECAGATRPAGISRPFLRAFIAQGLFRYATSVTPR